MRYFSVIFFFPHVSLISSRTSLEYISLSHHRREFPRFFSRVPRRDVTQVEVATASFGRENATWTLVRNTLNVTEDIPCRCRGYPRLRQLRLAYIISDCFPVRFRPLSREDSRVLWPLRPSVGLVIQCLHFIIPHLSPFPSVSSYGRSSPWRTVCQVVDAIKRREQSDILILILI